MDKKLRKLCKEFIDRQKIEYEEQDSLVNVSFVYECDGDIRQKMFFNEVCHSPLNYPNINNNLHYILTNYQNFFDKSHMNNSDRESVNFGDSSQVFCHRYVDWLINRSPFRHVFLNDSWEDIVHERTPFIVDTSYNNNYVAASCIATRLPFEFTNRCEVWYDLVEYGMDEDLAFLFTPMFLKNNFKEIEYYCTFFHNVFRGSLLNFIVNFYNFKLVSSEPSKKFPYCEKLSYNGVNDVSNWGIDSNILVGVNPNIEKYLVGNKYEDGFLNILPCIEATSVKQLDTDRVMELNEEVMSRYKELNK